MQLAARVRLVLARRPWIYWVAVAALAGAAGLGVERRLAAVDEARERWATSRSAVVAAHDHEPGDPLVVRHVELPEAAIPELAVERLPPTARATQRIAAGEVVVELDVSPGDGPAAAAGPDTLVVAVEDPLARHLPIGQAVLVAADGAVLADRAAVVEVVDDVAFVAMDPEAAPAVADAARRGAVALLLVP